MWSKDPWDTPIVKINNKHINGEILKFFNLKIIKEKIIENRKKIKEEDEIQVTFPQTKETLIKPNKINLNILYDDDDIIIINKLPGVVVHPGAGNYDKTIVNALMHYNKDSLSTIGD